MLRRELQRAHETGESDFGKHILPRILKSHRLMAYDFATNIIPGTLTIERKAVYMIEPESASSGDDNA